MAGVARVAGVSIAVVLGQQVHVVDDEAAPVLVSEDFPYAGVQQFAFVEGAAPPLKDITRGFPSSEGRLFWPGRQNGFSIHRPALLTCSTT